MRTPNVDLALAKEIADLCVQMKAIEGALTKAHRGTELHMILAESFRELNNAFTDKIEKGFLNSM